MDKMNAEERREARRRRILENPESRLRKITTLNTNEIVSNGHVEPVKDEPVNGVLNPELPNRTIPMCRATNVQSPINFEDRHVLKCEPKPNDLVHLKQNVHSRNVINHKVMIPSNTVLYIILSQAVLAFFYYDLGFLFGNSIILPFMLISIPELFTSKQQHDSIHLFVLLMLGFSQDMAKQLSRSVKLALLIGKRFCVYIFCFMCSYFLLKSLHFDVKHKR